MRKSHQPELADEFLEKANEAGAQKVVDAVNAQIAEFLDNK